MDASINNWGGGGGGWVNACLNNLESRICWHIQAFVVVLIPHGNNIEVYSI